MYSKFFKEAGRKEGYRRRVKEIRQIDARGSNAQTLKLTHAVDNKVTGVGNKLKGVDDKMDVVINGKPGLLATY
jgi:hypothetical protein